MIWSESMSNELKKYEVNVEPILRAIFFDSYYFQQDIVYVEAIEYIKDCIVQFGDGYWGKRYDGRDFERLSVQNDKDEIELKIRSQINQAYNKVLKAKNILATRFPKDVNIPEERYEKISIDKNNSLEIFFNKKVIRHSEPDLTYSKINNSKLIDIVNSNKDIRNQKEWIAAIERLLQ